MRSVENWLTIVLAARYAGTLVIGVVGGLVFYFLKLPLPWMLGALLFSLAAALLGAPLKAPESLRTYVVAVIGVMLGSGFTPDTLGQMGHWLLSLMGLIFCITVSAAVIVPYYIRIGRMDPVTALFAAMPGGLAEMMEIGRHYGGDERAIILAHTARIVVTITIVAVWFRLVLGYDVAGLAPFSHATIGPADAFVLGACAIGGLVGATRLHLPAPGFLGPMVLSAAAHIGGLTAGSPPGWLVIGAQVLLGTLLGCRFLGVPMVHVLRAIALSFGATAIMLAIALSFAVAANDLFGQTSEQVLLAYAPGGLTEMSLVAISMQADVAYIATHHLVRVVFLLAVASVFLGRIAGRLRRQEANP